MTQKIYYWANWCRTSRNRAWIIVAEPSNNIMKPTMNKQIVQMPSGQFPKILFLTTLSNHYDILGRCRSFEERLFYIIYAHKERLSHKELQRAITTQTYETLLSDKNNMSKGLLETYPNSPIMFKDTYFIDFLNLPKRHSEKRLKNGLLEHMKQFILELGKDFIFMDQEYCLNVGASSVLMRTRLLLNMLWVAVWVRRWWRNISVS